MSDPTGRAEPPAGAAAAGALLVRVAVTASVILLALVGAAAFLPGRRLWGINHLAFYPVALRIGLLALAGICFVPAVARKCYAALLGLARLAEARPRLGVSLIVAASLVSVAIFMRFHSATLLLGDGQLVANNFGYAAGNVQVGHAQTVDLSAILRTQPTAKGSTAAYYLAAKVSGGLSRHSPVAAIRGLNCILGGAFILVLLLVVMGGFATSLSAELRVWLGVLALSSGAMELFFGYIENYTPLLFFATLYVASSMVFMEKHRGAWLVAALGFLVASIFMHVAGILLLPSFGLLAGSIPIEKCRPTLARRLARWLAPALLVLVLVGTVGVAKFTGLGNDFLPLRTTGDLEGILSPAHWLDVLNEILLMMPAFPVLAVVAIASVLLARRPGLTARGTVAVGSELGVRHANVPGGLFALVVAAPCLLFLAVFKSEISVPRDWDLFALSSIGLVPAGLLLVRGATAHVGPRSAALIAAPVWAISVILGISWVGINADSDMAATRYERILEYEKAHASYAYEILATHYQDQQRLPQAIAAMEKAVTFSASPRMYVYLSNLYKAVGRTDDALRVLRKTVRQYPRHDGARNNLVLLLANTSYYDELLAVARDGTIYNPERPIYHYYYGAMLIREGRTQEGIQELVQCKRLGPGPEVMAEIDRVLGGLGPKDGK